MTRRGFHNQPRAAGAANPAQWRKLAWRVGLAALNSGPAGVEGAGQLREVLRGATIDSFPDQSVYGRFVAQTLAAAAKAYVETALEERLARLRPIMRDISDAAETLLGPAVSRRPDLDD